LVHGLPTGGGITFTMNAFVAVLPWTSVASQVTLVLPTLNTLPDRGMQWGATGPST
jgi:hypothetical protein